MTRRGTGNRQKKVVAPRGARGGEKPIRTTPPRLVSGHGPRRSTDPSPPGQSKRDTD